MLKIKDFIINHKDLIFLFLLSLVPLLWYGLTPNNLIFSNDVGYPLNPIGFLKARVFAWNSGWNFGFSQKDISGAIPYYSIQVFFTWLTQSVFSGQKMWVFVWFFGILAVMYFCIRKIPIFRDKPYMALIAAILFGFNHFQLHGWRVLWVARFSTYAALPIIFVLLVNYYENKISLFKLSLLIALVIFVLNGGGSPPVFGVTILMVIVVFCFYLAKNIPLETFNVVKKSTGLTLIVIFLSLFLSSFWLLPYLYYTFNSYNTIIESGGGITQMLGWTDVVSLNTSILNLFRINGISFWGIGSPTSGYEYLFYKNPLLNVLSFLWPLLAFSAVLLAKKSQEKKYIILLSIMAVIGIIFSAGTHAPFRDLYIFLLKTIPGFIIFRSAIYKFGGLLWFVYSILIAFSISSLVEKVNAKLKEGQEKFHKIPALLVGFFIILIFIYNFPILNSNFFTWSPSLTIMEKIPQYVFDFGKWADKNTGDNSKILLLPELNDNWKTEAFKWGYWSIGPVTYYLTQKNTLANDNMLTDSEQTLVKKIYENLKNNNPNWKILARFLGVRYLLVRKDYFYNLDWGPTTSPSFYETILAISDEVEKIKTFGQWELYKIKKDPYEKIYLPEEVISYLAQDEDIPKILSLSFETVNKEKKLVLIQQKDANIFKSSSQNAIVVVPGSAKFFLPVEKGKLVVPNPKFLPGSPFYFLTENKEKELVQNTKDEKQLIDAYLGLSLKRLGELNQMIDTNANLQDILQVLDRYSVLWGEINKTYQSLRANKNQSTYALVPRLRSYIWEERNFFAELINEQKSEAISNSLKNSYKNLGDLFRTIREEDEKEIPLSEYEQAYYDPNIVLFTSGYKWEVPETGIYEVYINSDSILANSENVILKVDDKGIDCRVACVPRNDKKESWQKIGEIELNKGEHGLKITADGIPVYSFKRGDILFYKTSSLPINDTNSIVNIKDTKLNPTRYKVEVASSGQPFTIVFNERFDKDWKAYIKDVSDKTYDLRKKTDKGLISGILNLKSLIFRLLDENIFNTLQLKPLSEQNHFMANGYANGWYVDSKQKNYEIVIEYLPQRLLWLGYSVSAVTVLGSIIYLVIKRKKE